MKSTVICILAIVVLGANSVPAQNSMKDFGRAMENYLNKMRKSMFNSMDYGDQLQMAHFARSFEPISMRSENVHMEINMTNLFISGMDAFKIKSSMFSNDTKRYSLNINVPQLDILGSYSLRIEVNISDIPMIMSDNGFMDMVSEDIDGVMMFSLGNSADKKLEMQNITLSDIRMRAFNSRINGRMISNSNIMNGNFEQMVRPEILHRFLALFQQYLMKSMNSLMGRFRNVDEMSAAIMQSNESLQKDDMMMSMKSMKK